MNQLILLAIAMLLTGIIMLVITIVMQLKITSFMDCPVITAKIVDRETSRHFYKGHLRSTYLITLSYSVNEAEYEQQLACGSEEYDLGVNKSIAIRYKSMNPKRIMIDNVEKNQENLKTLWIITGALFVLGALLFAIGVLTL